MKRKQIVGGIVAVALAAAMSPAFAQSGSVTGAHPTPAATPLPSARPKCINAPINNVPKDCAADVTIGATGSAAASSGSADIARQSSEANAKVGIGSPGMPPTPSVSPSSTLPKPAIPAPPATTAK